MRTVLMLAALPLGVGGDYEGGNRRKCTTVRWTSFTTTVRRYFQARLFSGLFFFFVTENGWMPRPVLFSSAQFFLMKLWTLFPKAWVAESVVKGVYNRFEHGERRISFAPLSSRTAWNNEACAGIVVMIVWLAMFYAVRSVQLFFAVLR